MKKGDVNETLDGGKPMTSDKEKGESKEYSSKEKEGSVDESYIIPEEFQRQVQELVSECESKECLSYIRECVYRKEDELRQAAMKKNKKGEKPSEFTLAGGPDY